MLTQVYYQEENKVDDTDVKWLLFKECKKMAYSMQIWVNMT